MQNKHPLCDAIEKSIIGSGGGGDKPRTPIESPDSLRSIAYARILDIVSEGEIYGFADQENPMTCVFLNETPVQNADGTLNFKNVQIDSRVGTQTQDYIKGFPSVESENLVNLELRKDIPWVRTFTNLSLSAVNIKVSTPLMQRTNTSNGDISGTTVMFRFDISVDGGPFQTLMYGAFTGKTTTKYERGHRIDLPAATTSWTIRVTRTTPDSTSAALSDAIYLEAFTEIIDAKLRYPMTALVASVFDASQFPNIPSRAFRMRGRIIRVPSNYDPDTRTYDGVWDGTFQSRYSNNPAWVFYDMATNSRYGLGQYVSPELIDKWFLYSIGQYCDGMVDDGFGGQEPRFTCNAYFQTQNDALKVMSDLASVFRGIVYAAGGAITAVADKLEDPVYQYTNANVIDGKFTYGGSAKKVRHTVALVSWNDMSDFGRAKVEYVDDEQGILRYGVQQTQVIAVGCTSRAQARRLGRYILATERLETDSVGFSVGLDGTLVAPGKIILVADSLRAGKRIGGRIVSADVNFVQVDDLPDVEPGDTLYVTSPDGDMMESEVHSIEAGDIIHLVTPLPHVPVAQSVWTLATTTERPKRYRVVGVTENEDATGYVISAIENVEAKYAYAEDGVWLEEPEPPRLPPTVIPSPDNLQCEQRDVVEQNVTKRAATLSWDAVYEATFYNVQWRSNYGSWVDLGNNPAVSRDIYDIPAGPFEVQVVAISSTGQRSQPTFGGPYEITPPGSPPGYVEEINNDIAQEIIDRFNADAEVAANAAADATAKANAALAAAQAYADVIAAQLNDIVDADEWEATTNYVIGDIVKWAGKLYRAETDNINQQPDTNPDDWLLMGNYSSLGEAVAASIQMGTQNASDIDAVSTSLSAVVARMPSGSGELATQASVADEATARASADAALGNRITVVEARMPAGSGQLATASALSSLDGRVTVVEGTVSTQASAITAVQTSLGEARRYASMLYAPGFEDATKWTPGSSGTIVNNPSNARNGSRYLQVLGGTVNGVAATSAERFAVTPGGKLRVGFYARQGAVAPNGYIRVSVRWYDATDTQITFTASTASTTALPANLTTYVKVDGTIDAPANAVWAAFVIQQGNSTGEWRVDDAYCEPYTENDVANASAITLLDTRLSSAEGTITAQGSAITSVQATLGGLGNSNLILNGSFEYQGDWGASVNTIGTLPGNTYYYGPSGNHVYHHDGVWSVWFQPDVNNRTLYNKSTIAVSPGQTIKGSMRVRTVAGTQPNAGTTVRLGVRWADKDDNALGFSYGTYITLDGSTAVYYPTNGYIENEYTAVTDAAFAKFFVYVSSFSQGGVMVDDIRASIPSLQDVANAAAVTALDTRVTTNENNVTALSSAVTRVESSIAAAIRVSNANFEVADGWGSAANGTGALPTGFSYSTLASNSGSRAMQIDANSTTRTLYNTIASIVKPGQRVRISAMARRAAAAPNGTLVVGVQFRDASGALISGTQINLVVTTAQAGTSYAYRSTIGDVPANAVSMRMYVQVANTLTSGGWLVDDVEAEVLGEDAVATASATQSLQASVTTAQNGVNTLNARYTLALDVNGYVSGIRSENTGVTSTFDILSDNVRILKPGGGARIEMSGGNIRVYDAGGVLRVRMGVW